MAKEYVAIEVLRCPMETDKAVCLVVPTALDEREVWVPRSQLTRDDRDTAFKGETEFEIEVSKWFAEREGMV